MRYILKGKNMDIGERTREKVIDKLERIAKLFPEDASATVLLTSQKLGTRVEVTIPVNKRIIRAEVSEPEMMAAVDGAVDILENQIVRYKKRLRTKMRHDAAAYQKEYDALPANGDVSEEESAFGIDKVKHFELKPMDAEEAVMEMELIGHSFFVFRNGKTDEVNVVYKRQGGTYGLIEPE